MPPSLLIARALAGLPPCRRRGPGVPQHSQEVRPQLRVAGLPRDAAPPGVGGIGVEGVGHVTAPARCCNDAISVPHTRG